ncbi:endocuticle structural glycoprotein SgAbd-2-like [Euwallacea similis]|uniref:endocuticle structural glycoprotein SgAbd-2-like n=1 Tax=Euwallacea similis TaxID=1736056 RepID=UPI00344FB23F
MNRIILAVAFFGIASCGRLDGSQYLPPNSQVNKYQGGGGGGSPQYQGGADNYQRSPNADIPILKLDNQNEGDGNYLYSFETGNGIQAQQQGSAHEGAGTQSQGSYSYTSPEGEQIQISYQADENGFQAQGSHIPTAPPVPEEIQKAIEQNLADEARGIVDDGQYRPEHQGNGEQGGYQQRNQYQGGAQSNQYIPPNAGQRQGGNGGYKY